MPHKLLVIMIDGVSADYFRECRGRLPHLSGLAERGLLIENLHSEVLGTSLPGRTSMITGVTADVSGIYGNKIWDGEAFRYANPDDIRVPTIPGRAKDAGLDVAVLGFGMVRPEDASVFKAPWWVREFIQRARDAAPIPSDDAWLRVYQQGNQISERLQRWCERAGYPHEYPEPDENTPGGYPGVVADQYALNWSGIAAASEDAPDFIITEYLTTDSIQHKFGYKSTLAHGSIAHADAMVGVVLERLRRAGVTDEWNIAVMSDHGHSPIETALYPQVLLPDVPMQSEGSILNIALVDGVNLDEVTEKMASLGAEPFHNRYVPDDMRDQIASFVAPPGMSFEPDDRSKTETRGRPVNISSHGLRPGASGDDRFAIFAGPDVVPQVIKEADAIQVAPTFAKLLGLPVTDFPADPVDIHGEKVSP